VRLPATRSADPPHLPRMGIVEVVQVGVDGFAFEVVPRLQVTFDNAVLRLVELLPVEDHLRDLAVPVRVWITVLGPLPQDVSDFASRCLRKRVGEGKPAAALIDTVLDVCPKPVGVQLGVFPARPLHPVKPRIQGVILDVVGPGAGFRFDVFVLWIEPAVVRVRFRLRNELHHVGPVPERAILVVAEPYHVGVPAIRLPRGEHAVVHVGHVRFDDEEDGDPAQPFEVARAVLVYEPVVVSVEPEHGRLVDPVPSILVDGLTGARPLTEVVVVAADVGPRPDGVPVHGVQLTGLQPEEIRRLLVGAVGVADPARSQERGVVATRIRLAGVLRRCRKGREAEEDDHAEPRKQREAKYFGSRMHHRVHEIVGVNWQAKQS